MRFFIFAEFVEVYLQMYFGTSNSVADHGTQFEQTYSYKVVVIMMMVNFLVLVTKNCLIGSFFAKLLKNGFRRILPFTGELNFIDSSD